jgi:hypothetical protein
MKKIFRHSAIFLSLCFFVISANAQLASDRPAQAAEVSKQVTKVKPAESKATAVQVLSSDKQADNNILPAAPAKSENKLPVVSDQGDVKPLEGVGAEPSGKTTVKPEIKIPQAPMQEEKKKAGN